MGAGIPLDAYSVDHAGGAVERMVRRVKTTAMLLVHSDTTTPPDIVLHLATGTGTDDAQRHYDDTRIEEV